MEDTQIKPQRNLFSLKTTKGVKLIIINNNLSLHIYKLVRALYHGFITIVTISPMFVCIKINPGVHRDEIGYKAGDVTGQDDIIAEDYVLVVDLHSVPLGYH